MCRVQRLSDVLWFEGVLGVGVKSVLDVGDV